MKIEQLNMLSESRDALVALLHDCVESGASIGFLAPLAAGEAEHYWLGVEIGVSQAGTSAHPAGA